MDDLGQPWSAHGPMVQDRDGNVIAMCSGSAPVSKLVAEFIARAGNGYSDFIILTNVITGAVSYANPAAQIRRILELTHQLLARPGRHQRIPTETQEETQP